MVLSVKLIIIIQRHYGTIVYVTSKNRVERLVSDRILDSIDLINYSVCVECVKGKHLKIKKFGAYRATYVLESIHADIYEPFSTPYWNDQ